MNAIQETSAETEFVVFHPLPQDAEEATMQFQQDHDFYCEQILNFIKQGFNSENTLLLKPNIQDRVLSFDLIETLMNEFAAKGWRLEFDEYWDPYYTIITVCHKDEVDQVTFW